MFENESYNAEDRKLQVMVILGEVHDDMVPQPIVVLKIIRSVVPGVVHDVRDQAAKELSALIVAGEEGGFPDRAADLHLHDLSALFCGEENLRPAHILDGSLCPEFQIPLVIRQGVAIGEREYKEGPA